jgi:hypothetical protein
MGQREQLVVFLVGAMMGVGILLAGRSCGHEKQDQLRRVRTALNLPPMMYDYAVMHKGFYGHYVLYSNVTQTPMAQVREVVTGGTRRYDANGRELPEEYLWITETYDLGVPLAEAGPVKSYSFAYADRFLLTMKAGHGISEAGVLPGEESQPVTGHPGQYLLYYAKAPHLSSNNSKGVDPAVWASAKNRLQALQNSPAVESAQWVKIDWEAEADLIRANTGKTR